MAFFNRKLFIHEPQVPKSSYMKPRTYTSLPCPPFCVPHCPDGCIHVPFPDREWADIGHYSFRRHHDRRRGHESLNVFFVVMIVLIIVSALVLCFSFIYVRVVRRRNRRGVPITVVAHDHAREHDNVNDHHDDGFVVEDDGMMVEHHVWYINTVGLKSSVINSIAVCKYKKDDGVVEGTVCAVCLSEFQEGESLRLLPKCNHAFHVSCIDTWLRSHTNCPMCRAPIVCKTTPDHSSSRLPPHLGDDHLSSTQNHHLRLESNGSFGQEPRAGEVVIRRTFSAGSCMVRAVSHLSIDIVEVGMKTDGLAGDAGSSSSSSSLLLQRGLGSMKRSMSCDGKFFSSTNT